ncbi:hypothetical protein COHA_002202 [Chlorella ohadii]|uniref:Uncharacterized protein n=1 Tax=Chlorella ohadii TaxID=2649997 RepID=A0AAD5DWW4_9CHLO|nr:hypothetical protein COHA_002202 [Chlorella ohadii]
MSQRDRALLCSLAAVSAGNIAWRRLAPARFAKWSCLTSVAMRCLTLGLGVAAYTMRAQLDEAGPPVGPPASTPLGITVEAVVVLVRLLFASLAPFMLLFHTTWHLRLGWSALAQAVLVGTTVRHARHVCGASSLSCPAVHAAVRRVYRGMQVAACLTPLPVWAALPDPSPEDQCTALVAFFQLAIGLLLPVLWQVLTEARFFQLHQRERRAAGLSPERGPEAAVYHFVWQATMEGMGLQATMLAWILLSTCWDQLSFLVRSTPVAAAP